MTTASRSGTRSRSAASPTRRTTARSSSPPSDRDGKVLTVDGPLVDETASGDEKILVQSRRRPTIDDQGQCGRRTRSRAPTAAASRTTGSSQGMRFDALRVRRTTTTTTSSRGDGTVITVEAVVDGVSKLSERRTSRATATSSSSCRVSAGRCWTTSSAARHGARRRPSSAAPRLPPSSGRWPDADRQDRQGHAVSTDARRTTCSGPTCTTGSTRSTRACGTGASSGWRSPRRCSTRRAAATCRTRSATRSARDTPTRTIRCAEPKTSVGLLDVLIEELDDPNGDGSTTDSFINKHLLPMFGLPSRAGRAAQRPAGRSETRRATCSQPIEDVFNPIEAAINEVKDLRHGLHEGADRGAVRVQLRGCSTS